jgi:hypothetical protein
MAKYELDKWNTDYRADAEKRRTRDIPWQEQEDLFLRHKYFFGDSFDFCLERFKLAYPKYKDTMFWMTDDEIRFLLSEEQADVLNHAFMLMYRHLATGHRDWYAGAMSECDHCHFQTESEETLGCASPKECALGSEWTERDA